MNDQIEFHNGKDNAPAGLGHVSCEPDHRITPKEADLRIRFLAGIINDTIKKVRDIAPNGLSMQHFEKYLVSSAEGLSIDIGKLATGGKIMPRTCWEEYSGRPRVMPMTDDEARRQGELFDPEPFYVTTKPR